VTGVRQRDIEALLAKRHDNGGDFWATMDGKLGVGDPFSTLTSLLLLHELGVDETHEAVGGAIRLVLEAWREDGRFRLAPKGSLYPCYTAAAARALCRFGYGGDRRLLGTFEYLLQTQHDDGGWRCRKFPYGRGPETEFSNPGVTLAVLDAFRFTARIHQSRRFDTAVESLLTHWTERRPLGPCHFGIGTLFMQVEYPLLRYNLFNYVYVLSFFDRAKEDPRFLEAFRLLESKLDASGRLVVERPNRKLAHFSLCRTGQPSESATVRFREIAGNLGRRAGRGVSAVRLAGTLQH
jgi:hypothetical protein